MNEQLEKLINEWEGAAEREDREFHRHRDGTRSNDLLEGMLCRAQTYRYCAEKLKEVIRRG